MGKQNFVEYEPALELPIGPDHGEESINTPKSRLNDLLRVETHLEAPSEKIQKLSCLTELIMRIAEDALKQNMFAVPGFDAYAIAYDTLEDRLCIVTHSRSCEALLFSEVEYAQEMADKYNKPLLEAYRALYYSSIPVARSDYRDVRDEDENCLSPRSVLQIGYPQ